MATVTTAAGRFTVPDDVARDYTGDALPVVPDDTWTVAQLRERARHVGVAYKGLKKPELLEALT
jgi:hypothetical protein